MSTKEDFYTIVFKNGTEKESSFKVDKRGILLNKEHRRQQKRHISSLISETKTSTTQNENPSSDQTKEMKIEVPSYPNQNQYINYYPVVFVFDPNMMPYFVPNMGYFQPINM